MLLRTGEETNKINKNIFHILIFSIFVASCYYVPVLLIWFEIIPFEFRFQVLIIITIISAIYSFFRNHSLYDLGFRLDNIKYSLFLNCILILLALIFLTTLYYSDNIRSPVIPEWKWFYIFYILISAPSQEFVFRSVLFAELKKTNINSLFFKIILTSVTYSFLHLIYNDLLTLLITLLMGIVWGVIYSRTGNFWGVAFTHAVLGIISINIGLI